MHETYEKLQQAYIAALRPVVADALSWWDAHCPYSHTEPRSWEEMHPFHQRWIAGPAAHPRVIAVFRDYFFQVLQLNDQSIASASSASSIPEDEQWGHDRIKNDDWIPYQRPIDVLVNDLLSIEPELHDVMQGLRFIPIGSDPQSHEEC